MEFTFNRTVTALVFEIPVLDYSRNRLWSTASRFTSAFYEINDGEQYPCGNHGFGVTGKVKCILQR